jgi:hypothetical protein
MRQLARTVTDHNPFRSPLSLVQAIARYIQALRCRGGVKHREDSFNRVHQVRPYPAPVAAFIETFQATMLETPNHLSQL